MTLHTADVPCTATGHLPLSADCVLYWLVLPFLSTLATGSYSG